MADTSVGSIKGELKLDISDYMEGIGQAKAGEESLHDTEDMKIDADVDQALAKIEAVRAAARGLSDEDLVGSDINGDASDAIAKSKAVAAATRDLEVANKKVEASYQRLGEAQDSAGEGSARYLSAQAGLTKSLNTQHDAFDKLNTTIDAEKTKVTASAEATDKDTKAKKSNSEATDKSAKSHSSLLSALIPLAPALIPIAAGAAGVASALGGMAVTAVVAIMGVSDQMKQGTEVGQRYSKGLSTLKSDFGQLKSVAAAGALEGFEDSVDSLNSSMPTTTRLVALLAQDAGKISGHGVSGLLGFLQRLQPVIQQVDSWALRGAESFDKWGNGNGASDFVAYMLAKLPQVESFLGSTVGAVGNVVRAFEPWGSGVLAVVTSVMDAIDSIPTPVLATFATAGMTVFTVFKAWGIISGIINGVKTAMTGLSTATGIAAGPIGLVVAGIGLLAAAYAAFSAKTGDATQSQTSFTTALQQSNGAIDSSVRAQMADNLQKSGAIEKAKQLGISTSELVDAALNQGDAYEKVSSVLSDTTDKAYEHANVLDKQQGVTAANAAAATQLKAALDTERTGISDAKTALDELNGATKDSMASSTGMQTILGLSSQKWNELSAAENDATTAANNYKTALDLLNGGALALEAAQNKLAQDFNSGSSTIQNNIKQTDAVQATSMDRNTTYGYANREMIRNMIIDSQTLASSIIKDEGDSVAARQKANQSLTDSKNKILDFAKANGLSTDEVQKMLDTMDQYNTKDLPPKAIKVTDQASKTLDAVQLKAKSIKDGKVVISGENKDALAAIAQVVGKKIDPKTGTLTLDKGQYDVALAVANGAKIDTKTGYIIGNNSDAFNKVAQANGWKIDPKTGVISGDDGPFKAAKSAVEAAKIKDKKIEVGANTDSFWGTVNGILGKVFHVNIGASGKGNAEGGAITGPGTSTSDSIPRWLSNGEHVLTAADVNAMGGQKAVYSFRSSLHSGRAASTPSLGSSKTQGPQSTTTQMAYPPTITLVDADGAILGRMKVVVENAMSTHNSNLRRGLING